MKKQAALNTARLFLRNPAPPTVDTLRNPSLLSPLEVLAVLETVPRECFAPKSAVDAGVFPAVPAEIDFQ